MSDESLREFQLNGKQLVFLFMASTIVAVVIFLCGVMVGRGVSAAQLAAVPSSTVDVGDPTAGEAPLTPVGSNLTAAPADVAPDVPSEDGPLTYPDTLTSSKVTDDLQPAKRQTKASPKSPVAAATKAPVVAKNTNAPATTASTAVARPPAPAAPSAATSPVQNPAQNQPPRVATTAATPAAAVANTPEPAEPAGNGFVVQVAATPRKTEADAIRGRLQQKGYPAFVTTSGRLFRVRVGKYKDRTEANAIAKRLETQERFKPWVTR